MWPLTREQPKHLLPVNGKPMLSYILDKVLELEGLENVYLSTNLKFKANFQDFIRDFGLQDTVELFIEDTMSEGEKLGSIGALNYLIGEKKLQGDLFVIGGDNLFDFSLAEMVNFARERQGDAIAVYDVGSRDMAKKYGIVDLDENQKMVDFLEKPENPPSTLASTACYFFSAPSVARVGQYIREGNNPDAMGHFISWLHRQTPVFGFSFSGYWFDIGSFESLDAANEFFGKQES